MKLFLHLVSLFTALATIWISSGVWAQQFPTRPIQVVVPFAPGGSTDLVGRLIATKLSERFGMSVVVANRPGADGQIAARFVANTVPDGYVIFLGTGDIRIFDELRDLQPIGVVAKGDMLLLVNLSSGVTSVQNLIAQAQGHSVRMAFSSGASELTLRKLEAAAKVEFGRVPFRGPSDAFNALAAGETIGMFASSTFLPQFSDRRVKPLAVAADGRSDLFPNVPTLAQEGINNVVGGQWMGFLAPKGTSLTLL
jgi:tripartite-type tricarboxylate transporter receptor subunit TctC